MNKKIVVISIAIMAILSVFVLATGSKPVVTVENPLGQCIEGLETTVTGNIYDADGISGVTADLYVNHELYKEDITLTQTDSYTATFEEDITLPEKDPEISCNEGGYVGSVYVLAEDTDQNRAVDGGGLTWNGKPAT